MGKTNKKSWLGLNTRPSWSVASMTVLVLVLGSVGAGTFFAGGASATVPGSPGVPQPGTPVFVEDFENGTTNTALGAQSYSAPGSTTYVGATGETYTGSPAWIDAARCNGVILSNANSTTPAWAISGSVASGANNRCSEDSGVLSYQFLRMLALGMGQQFSPGSPTTQHVSSSYTECQSTDTTGGQVCDTIPAGPANGVMFKTVKPISVTPGHYYTFGVDTAYTNCNVAAADPSYQFAWTDSAGVAHPIGSPVNGCQTTSDPNVKAYTQSVTANIGGAFGTVTKTVRINSMTSNAPFQASTSAVGIEMWNNNGTTNGNDGAFDNVRLIDVTPQVDKAFSPALIAPGGTSTLTITVTNTSELDAKNDWTLTDTLPAGMTIAGNATVGGTCKDNPPVGVPFAATAVAGSGSIAVVGGDLPSGQASCTITVDVTATSEGSYTNGPLNVTTNLSPPGPATLVVKAPRITLTKALGTARAGAGDQFTVEIHSGSATGPVVNATANSTTTGSGSTVGPGTGTTGAYPATAGSPYFLTESSANLAAYTTTIACTDSAGLQTGLPNGAAFNGSISVTPVAGAAISCTLTNNAIPTPDVNIAKTVGAVTGPDANGLYTVDYDVVVHNSGTATATYGPLTDTPDFAANLTTTAGSWTGAGSGTWNGTGSIVLRGSGTTLAAGATDTYHLSITFTYTNQTQATSCAGPGTGLFNSVSVPAGQEQGTTSDNSACTTPPSPPAPSLSLVKTVQETALTGPGQVLHYSFVVTNTGEVTLHDLSIDDGLLAAAGIPVTCPRSTLAPSESMTCVSAEYSVTQADVDAGHVGNVGLSRGTTPTGDPVESPTSSTNTPLDPDGGLTFTDTPPGSGGILAFTGANVGRLLGVALLVLLLGVLLTVVSRRRRTNA